MLQIDYLRFSLPVLQQFGDSKLSQCLVMDGQLQIFHLLLISDLPRLADILVPPGQLW